MDRCHAALVIEPSIPNFICYLSNNYYVYTLVLQVPLTELAESLRRVHGLPHHMVPILLSKLIQ